MRSVSQSVSQSVTSVCPSSCMGWSVLNNVEGVALSCPLSFCLSVCLSVRMSRCWRLQLVNNRTAVWRDAIWWTANTTNVDPFESAIPDSEFHCFVSKNTGTATPQADRPKTTHTSAWGLVSTDAVTRKLALAHVNYLRSSLYRPTLVFVSHDHCSLTNLRP